MKHKSNILMVLLLFSLVLVVMGMVSASDDVNETISTTNDDVDLSTAVEDVSGSDDSGLFNVGDSGEFNDSVGSNDGELLGLNDENNVLSVSSFDVNDFDDSADSYINHEVLLGVDSFNNGDMEDTLGACDEELLSSASVSNFNLLIANTECISFQITCTHTSGDNYIVGFWLDSIDDAGDNFYRPTLGSFGALASDPASKTVTITKRGNFTPGSHKILVALETFYTGRTYPTSYSITVHPIDSFYELQREINGATNSYNITRNYKYYSGDPTDGITINKALTINGNNFTLEGKNTARIFSISSSSNVYLNDIIFANAFSNFGSALLMRSNGNLYVNHCSFINGTMGSYQYSTGAAIYNDNGYLFVNNSIFINNSNPNYYGGAIHTCRADVYNSKFINNTAKNGGAIHSQTSRLIIFNSSFNKNKVTQSGGAIYILSDNCLINCSYFNENEANTRGGSICYAIIDESGNPLNILDSVFVGNKANEGGCLGAYDYGKFNVQSSLFINNYASSSGSAISSSSGSNGGNTVKNSIILNNTAGTSDVSLKIISNTGSATFSLDYNWWGNNVTNKNSITSVIGSIPSSSTLSRWLYLDSTTTFSAPICQNTTILIDYNLNHYATSTGVGSYDASKLPNITFNTGSTLEGNFTISPLNGGEFSVEYITPDGYGDNIITVEYNMAKFNKYTNFYPADSFYALQQDINQASSILNLNKDYHYYNDYNNELSEVLISKNLVLNGNGHVINASDLSSIFRISIGEVNLNSLNLVNARSSTNGGAVYHTSGILRIIDSSFYSNFANENGGAVYHDGGTLVISGCIFDSNRADTLFGGAIYSASTISSLISSNFTSNHGRINGGAIYTSDAISTLDNCNFVGNEANYGGAIYQYYSNTIAIVGSYFNGNEATLYGGAIASRGSTNVQRSTFINNYAGSGGAILYNDGSSQDSITNSIIVNNNGGATPKDNLFYRSGDGTFTLNNNWWGNNATNKNSITSIIGDIPDGATLDYWLYMDSESDISEYDVFDIGESTTINFNLNHRATSTGSDSYDASRLPCIYLDLVAYGGNISQDNISFYGKSDDFIFTFVESSDVASVVANYGGLFNFYHNFKLNTYNVSVSVNLDVTPYISDYGATITVNGNINYPNGALLPRGSVYLTLGDKIYSCIVDGSGAFTLEINDAVPGIYYELIDVYFHPDSDEIYYTGEELVNVTIKKLTIYKVETEITDLTLSGEPFIYGNSITFGGVVGSRTGADPYGNVSVYLDGNVNNVITSTIIDSRDNGEFSIIIPNVPSGEHYFTVKYNGNDCFWESINNTNRFTVNPTTIIFLDSTKGYNGYYNGSNPSAYVIVNVTGSYGGDAPRGIVMLNVSGQTWTADLVDGVGRINVNRLGVGTYSGSVMYIADVNEHNFANQTYEGSVSFTIVQGTPEFSILAPSIGWGSDARINIILPDDATGSVTLKIDADTYIFDDLANNRTLILTNPDAGAYIITASYSGDANWEGVDKVNTTLYVERPNAELNVTVHDISYGSDEIIEISILHKGVVETSAKGTVTIYGLNSEGLIINITNGIGVLNVSDLSMGNYNIVAYYSGYNDLAGDIKTASFKVYGLYTKMTLTLNSTNIFVGDSVNLTVIVNSTIDDPIYLFVDGERYGVVIAENGIATFIISALGNGTHNLTTVLYSNDRFNGVSNSTLLNVSKVDPLYRVDVISDSYRNILFDIFVAGDATGSVSINGNGTVRSLTLVNGSAETSLMNVHSGIYSFNITYSGDDKYNSFSVVRSVDSSKDSNYEMNITSSIIVRGQDVTIFVNLPNSFRDNGTVNLTINSISEIIDLVNGSVNKTIFIDDSFGNTITVTAVYSGFDDYASKTVTRVFNIEPSDEYIIDITMPDGIFVGDNVTVNITAPIQITNVTVSVDTLPSFIVNLTNGETSFNLSDIGFGNHKIIVTYEGDDLYYKAKSFEREFNVGKITPVLIVGISNITYGENALIEVSVFDEDMGLSGIVLVTINETKYYVSVDNGYGSLPIIGLNKGEYTYKAVFMETSRYNSAVSPEDSFIVSPRAVFIDIDTCEGANYHENGEVKVFLYDYVTGEKIIADVELIFTDSDGSEIYRINVTSTTKEHGHSGSAVIESMDWEIGKYNIIVYNPNYVFLQEEDEPVTYTFALYDENKQTQYAQGTFEVTDDERDDGFIEIKVINSDVDTYIGNVYYIESDSLSLDGVTLHSLFEYDEQSESMVPVDLWTTLSQLPVSYEFASYEYNGEYIEYGHGTFNTTGIIEGDFTQVIVLDYNVSPGYIGQYFYINFTEDNEGYFKVCTKINDQFVDSGFYVTFSEVENGPKEFEYVEYLVHKTYLYDEDVSIFEGDGEYLYNTPHNVILELTYDGQFVDITCTGSVTVCYWDDENLIETNTPFSINFINGVAEFTLPVIAPGEYVLKVNITDDNYELVRWGDDELLNYTVVSNFNVAEDHVYINDEFVNGVSEGLFRDVRVFNFTLWHNYELGSVEVDEPFAYTTYANLTVYRWNSENDDYEIVDGYDNIRIEILDGISESIDLTDLLAGDYKITVVLDDEYYKFNDWDDDIQSDVDYKSFYFNIEEDNPYVHTINWMDWINYGQEYTINFTLMHNNEEVLVYDTIVNVTLYKIINNDNVDEYVFVSSTLVDISDGYLNELINWTCLDAGNYKVTVSLEDQYYSIHDWDQGMEVNYQTFWFNVNRANPIVDFIVPHNLVYGDDLTFTINITGVYGETLNETVHVFIENYNFVNDIVLVDGFNSTTVSDLNAGTYVVFLSFDGDTNYEAYNGWHSAYVDKYTPDLTVDVDSINYGGYPEFDINLIGVDNTGIDGAVLIITVNNQYVYIKTTDNGGNVHFTADELYTVGDYNVTITFTGNNNYNSYTNDSECFNVLEGDSGFTAVIENPDIEYLNNLVITVNTTTAGKVYIILKDDTVYRQFNVSAGVSELNITGLGVGVSDNSARVIFEADNYQTKIVPIAFEVAKATTGISLDVEEINATIGDDVEIRYNIVPGIVEGNVTLWINNMVYGNYPITQSNGSIIITKDKLASNGTYIIKVQFIDTTGDYMDSNTDEITVNVAKINVTSNVTVTGCEVVYGEDASVTVVFDRLDDVEGIVVVVLDGVNGVYDAVVSAGSAVVPIPGLKGNQTYHINTIEYSGDNKYDSFTIGSNEVVKVKQAQSIVSIDDIVDVTYLGDVIVNYNIVNETVVVILVQDAEGKNVTSGVNASMDGIVNITGLIPGKYSITINNNETVNYAGSSATKSFYVFKEDAQVRIDPEIIIGDISGCVGDTVSVNVTIAGGDATGYMLYNGLFYTVNNGTAVIPVKLLNTGMQSITVTYTGDSKYNNGTGYKAFDVGKSGTTIILVEDEISTIMGENVEIEYIIAPDVDEGNVSLWINNEWYGNFPVTQSEGSILILSEYLPANGTYIIKVQYTGNTNYNDSNIDTLVLNVYKIDIEDNTTVKGSEITYGETASVSVDFSTFYDVRGIVYVTVEGVGIFNATADNGIAFVEIPGLKGNKTYTVTKVEYTGDNKYEGFTVEDDNIVITVKQATSSVIIDEISTVSYGDNVTVTYSVVNKTSVEIIVMDEKGNVINNIDIVDGIVSIPGLNAGVYTITIINAESENYLQSKDSKIFNVDKIDSIVSISHEKDGNGEVVVSVDVGDATGMVNMIVNGIDHLLPVDNGKVNYTINGSDLGQYNITASYMGDNNYNPNVESISFNVSDNKTHVDPDTAFISPDKDNPSVFGISLPDDATGNFTILVDGNVYGTAVLIDGKANITLDNLSDGSHDISMIYSGDDNYAGLIKESSIIVIDGNSTSGQVSPGDADSVFSISNGTAYPPVFSINLLGDASGNFTVSIGGKDYTVPVVDGKANITVDGLSSGSQSVVVSYSGDKKYSGLFKTATVNVTAPTPSPAPGPTPAGGKLATVLIAKKKVTFKKSKLSKTKTFKFTLKSGIVKLSGKKVYFKLDKKALKTIKVKKGSKAKKAKKILKQLKKGTYGVKTKGGVAKLKLLKSLFIFKKGKGKITAAFKGDNSYRACKKVMNIVIK